MSDPRKERNRLRPTLAAAPAQNRSAQGLEASGESGHLLYQSLLRVVKSYVCHNRGFVAAGGPHLYHPLAIVELEIVALAVLSVSPSDPFLALRPKRSRGQGAEALAEELRAFRWA